MANCPNCGAALNCGCQRKTASDGKQGCVQCIPAYEQRLKKQNERSVKQPSSKPPSKGATPFINPIMN